MSWYTASVPHNRIARGQTVWLPDVPDVIIRVEKGILEPADEPDWFAQLSPEKQDEYMEDT